MAAVIRPVIIHMQLIRRELPILLGSSIVFLVMMSDKHLARWEGAVLAVGILVYIIANVSLSRKAKCVKQFEEFEQEEIEQAKKGGLRVFFDIVLILLGIVALVLGADWLVDHGEQIATIFGVPDVVISLTLFALGTSLPELATAIVAALKRQGDIITGNAIGSCIFNILAVIGVTAAVKPVCGKAIAWLDLGVMMGLTIIIVPLMWTSMKLNRKEGAVLIFVAFAYATMVIVVQR